MTHFGQHKASPTALGWREDGDQRGTCTCSQVASLIHTCTYEQSMNRKYSYKFPRTLLNQPVDPTLHSKKSLNVPFLATKSAVLSTMSVGHRSGRQLQERSSLRCKHRKQRYTQQEPHSLAFAILQFLITYSIQKQRGRLGRFCHVNVLNIYLVDRDEDDSEQPWSFSCTVCLTTVTVVLNVYELENLPLVASSPGHSQ